MNHLTHRFSQKNNEASVVVLYSNSDTNYQQQN